MRTAKGAVLGLLLLLVMGTVPAAAVPEGPAPGTPDWYAREASNFARAHEEMQRELTPAFQSRLNAQSTANLLAYNARQLSDPSWNSFGNVCQTWQYDCAGDPFRYPGVDPFYDSATVTPINFYDSQGARLNGRIWAPKGATSAHKLPAVVIETGSVQAPEPLYWWFAETLVRNGYVTMTFDVRGQGMSDNIAPGGTATPDDHFGTNVYSPVFWTGLIDAIDFFRSSPAHPYPNNTAGEAMHPKPPRTTDATAYNPAYQLIDPARFGIAGHSLGATGVSIVQGYGAPGADPWPGKIDHTNPVDVTVAWDNLTVGSSQMGSQPPPAAVPRVPAMGSSNDYSLTPTPYASPPGPDTKKLAFQGWQKAQIPSIQLVIQGGTHFEYSLIPSEPAPFPATNWFTWGNPIADHYSLAWFDRWLKQPGEAGFADADKRLLADKDWGPRMSFYLRTARDFSDRQGVRHHCEDVRAGCTDTAAAFTPPPYVPAANTPAMGGAAGGLPNSSAPLPLPLPALIAMGLCCAAALRFLPRRGHR
ncbi:MAG: alpha/beta hydrolase family protein [Candidatus Dormibacteria bacterium]